MAKMPAEIGHIDGVALGTLFANRQALRDARIHRPLQAGIDGSAQAAYSIVVSGGYVDDEDYGNRIIYTGHGGNDPATKRQVADQKWTLGNAALQASQQRGTPVRVVRGAKGAAPFAPAEGYRYDGLFLVEQCWDEIGVDDFLVCRFRLTEANHLVPERDRGGAPPEIPAMPESPSNPAPPSRALDVQCPDENQMWVELLVASPLFADQVRASGTRLDSDRAELVMKLIDANGGQLRTDDLAAVLETPTMRLRGFLATLTRVLNLDGYEVLVDDGSRVRLDAALAKTQFGIE